LSKFKLSLAYVALILAAISCGPRQALPDLQGRKDFEHLKALCLESTTNLYVLVAHGTRNVSPTDDKPGPRGPVDWIEPAGAKLRFTEFGARNSFDGVSFYIDAEMTTSAGETVKIMGASLIDYSWFHEAAKAARNGEPAIDFPDDQPPIETDFLRVCQAMGAASQ
jgi:hypothetical protein